MEYPYHACIPVWLGVRSSFGRLDHDIRVRPQFYGVPVASDIVSRIVDAQRLASIEAFPSDAHSIPFFVCELAIGIALVISLE